MLPLPRPLPARFPRRAIAAALLTGVLSATLVTAVAAPASAHTPSVSASCSTLSVALQYYAWSESNPRPNTVTVSIDGAGVASERFGGSFVRDFSLGDSTRAHTWRVLIDAVDNYDRTFDGTSAPCAPPTPKDAAASLHTTPASCSAAATLVLDSVTNATWSAPTRTQGPGNYSVVATAAKGHLFDDGTTTRAFSGTLAGALGAAAPGCQPPTPPTTTPPPSTTPPVPPRVTPVGPKPAPLLTSSRFVDVSCADALMTITTTRTTIDWVLNATRTAWIQAEPVSTTTTSTHRVLPGDCPDESDAGGTPPTTGGDNGSGSGSGAAGGGAGGGSGGGMVGGAFDLGSSVGSGIGAGVTAGLDSLAHAGAEAMAAIFLAISLLAAGGIILLRRREAELAGGDAPPTEE